jgi:CHAT domain-containing protein
MVASRSRRRIVTTTFVAASLSSLGATLLGAALAATHDEIVDACKEQARPAVVECVRSKFGTADKDTLIAQCRESAGRPFVMACVRREELKEAAGKAAPAAPTAPATPSAAGAALVVQPVFVAPPRTIADVTAILDKEKPDEAVIAKRKAAADVAPPAKAAPAELVQFYYDRGAARAYLGRDQDALADALQAVSLTGASTDWLLRSRVLQFVELRYAAIGDFKSAMTTSSTIVREAEANMKRGAEINALAVQTRLSVKIGDLSQADAFARRVEALVQEARGSPNPKWRASYEIYGTSFESDADGVRALVLESQGRYADAEAAYRRCEAFRRASLKALPRYEHPPPAEQLEQAADMTLLAVARMESKQGRIAEAEADARRALLEILDQQGKYSTASPDFINGLAAILVEEGRYAEAEQLFDSSIEVQKTIGVAADSPTFAQSLALLGAALVAQNKMAAANEAYAQLDAAIAQWPPERREIFQHSESRVAALYDAGKFDEGIAAAQELVKRLTASLGAGAFDTASAQGLLAIGYARAGRDADAIAAFKAAIPILTAESREEADSDDPTLTAARGARVRRAIEAYIRVLAKAGGPDVAAQTFALADLVRGHVVDRSLSDSSARAAAKDPALGELARNEQDLSKQLNAELGVLDNMLSLPADQRDAQVVNGVNAEITKLRAAVAAAKQEIDHRFPAYAGLTRPGSPPVSAIQAVLKSDEAMVSFYFGRFESFVWVIPKQGAIAFAPIPMTAVELSQKVGALRKALEPDVARVEEIPAFDVALAHDLYASLLGPVEKSWQGAKSLIVATNGALGELPLGLLPTEAVKLEPVAGQPLFAEYRNVPWLARTHAVTVVPSATALVTLRSLPPGAAQREKLIGFGDPYFSPEEAAAADAELAAPAPVVVASASDADAGANVTRGAPLKLRAAPKTEGVDVAELAMLPRLPDTREELTAMARALDVDPDKALFLGRAANEEKVEGQDLSRYRIVAFATHGLVPGDLDGLTQPALALSAPEVAGVKGDGLLTVEKILALKLDADWVVLSACNTGAASGAGAEAASGLGSAFFYAGTRALLVTNWSVHTVSARQLTSDLFRRQGADAGLSRGEALRQSMMALLDGPGAVDAQGRSIYTYAHPLFWAPFTLIGDGGGS